MEAIPNRRLLKYLCVSSIAVPPLSETDKLAVDNPEGLFNIISNNNGRPNGGSTSMYHLHLSTSQHIRLQCQRRDDLLR